MAGTYRPTIIRFYDAQGRQVRKGTPAARRTREKSKTFWGRCADAEGKIRSVALCDDEQAAEEMLAAMKQRAKRIARGDVDPFEDHRSRPLAEHVEHLRTFLESKGNTAAHVALTLQRITSAFDGCKFNKLSDLNAGRVVGWLADRRKPKTNKDGEVIAGKMSCRFTRTSPLGCASGSQNASDSKTTNESSCRWIVRQTRS